MSDYGCPFCERDPFHYVDNGLGMEAVAVTCCEMGVEFFRGAQPEPETVTISWDDFNKAGCKIASLRAQLAGVVKVIDDKLAQYEEIENGRGGLTELGKHAQMSVRLLRKDISYVMTLTDENRKVEP